jgi:hypothetical protein
MHPEGGHGYYSCQRAKKGHNRHAQNNLTIWERGRFQYPSATQARITIRCSNCCNKLKIRVLSTILLASCYTSLTALIPCGPGSKQFMYRLGVKPLFCPRSNQGQDQYFFKFGLEGLNNFLWNCNMGRYIELANSLR